MSDAQRPDPSDPTRIPSATFATVRRGWDPDAVRAFLTAVAAELQRAHGRIAELEAAAPGAVDLSALPDDEIARLVGEETAAVLATAREGATALRLRAEAKATELLDDAAAEANRVREAASEDAARRRAEAADVAAAEIADAKERGREMVAEANRHRDQVSAALEQRRRAARDWAQEVEVEQRRLLEVFERARAVADDVVARLRPAPVSTDDADLRGDTRAVVESAITAAGDTAADAAGGAVYDLATEDGSDQVTSPDAEADIADEASVADVVAAAESAVDTEGDDDGDADAGSNVVHLFGAEPAPEAATDAAVTPEPEEAADGETSV
ncbi:MAG: DivIVA domain-containing protein, partial [Ilumatobacteraceae bacterium]